MRAIVIYAACGGQTRRIAMRIAADLSRDHLPTDTYDVTQQPADEIAIEAYDAAILGSPFCSGQPDPRIGWLIAAHRERLSLMPSAFFSVSSTGADPQASADGQAAWTVEEFLRSVEYEPAMRACFTNALHESDGGWFKKQLRHWMAAETATAFVSADDGEHYDWQAVDEFAKRFASFALSCALAKPKQPIFLSASEPLNYFPTRQRGLMER